jgi:hypothetical protein
MVKFSKDRVKVLAEEIQGYRKGGSATTGDKYRLLTTSDRWDRAFL